MSPARPGASQGAGPSPPAAARRTATRRPRPGATRRSPVIPGTRRASAAFPAATTSARQPALAASTASRQHARHRHQASVVAEPGVVHYPCGRTGGHRAVGGQHRDRHGQVDGAVVLGQPVRRHGDGDLRPGPRQAGRGDRRPDPLRPAASGPCPCIPRCSNPGSPGSATAVTSSTRPSTPDSVADFTQASIHATSAASPTTSSTEPSGSTITMTSHRSSSSLRARASASRPAHVSRRMRSSLTASDAGVGRAVRDVAHLDDGEDVSAGCRDQVQAVFPGLPVPVDHLELVRLDRRAARSTAAVRRAEEGSFMKRPPVG